FDGFGLRDIKVEEHGAVSVQDINDVSFTLAVDKVRGNSSANLRGPFFHIRLFWFLYLVLCIV
ncbi:MAG: hypothetical protein AAGI07_02735, partial [Bacteroidota bacterium]